MKKTSWHILTLTARYAGMVALLAVACSDPLAPVSPAQYRMAVPTLSAVYQGGIIRLSWQRPAGAFDYYNVYRAVVTDTGARFDTSMLRSTLRRNAISAGSLSFDDTPEPGQGDYYYGIRAVKVENGVAYEGELSLISANGTFAPVVVKVGDDVRLLIKDGDDNTPTNRVMVTVRDPEQVLSSVRFTQLTTDTGTSSVSMLPLDTFGQVAQMRVLGIFGPVSSRRPGTVPDFLKTDPDNAVRTYSIPAGTGGLSVPWVLSLGPGQKNVWAEVTFNDGTIDTLLDFILPSPHKIEIVMRHPTGSLEPERFDTTEIIGEATKKVSIFYTTDFRFSVKTFNDTTLSDTFEVWLVTGQNYDRTLTDALKPWVMTKPRTEVLDVDNPDKIFEFNLDTSKTDARQNLMWLGYGQYGNIDSVITGDYARSAWQIDYMLPNAVSGSTQHAGRKQFMLVLRFKERYFGGTFILPFGYENNVNTILSYRDIYAPQMKFDARVTNPDHLRDGMFINKPFSFALDTFSIRDKAFETTTNVELVIARLPQNYAWNPATTPDVISLAEIESMSHEVFPFSLEKPDLIIRNVRWDNIDPMQWSTGYYVCAVVVSTAKGGRKFANIDGTPKADLGQVNPFRVFISTSR